MKKKPGEDQREFLRRIGRKGGLKAAGAGGRATLKSMTRWERLERAHNAALLGGAPRRIDHAKVKALRAEGLKHREIAEHLGASVPSVYRILAKEQKKR